MMAAESFRPDPAQPGVSDWDKSVRIRYRNKCANCGNDDRLRARMIIPEEAGGKLLDSNSVLLCRSCEMASDAVKTAAKAADQRLVNFWVSRGLFDRIQEGLRTYDAFNSMGSLVRYLISKYVEDDSRFDDLDLYQDEGADTKINVWVERDRYDTFKTLVDKHGLTVTDAIKSLIVAYECSAEPLITKRVTGETL